MDLDPQADPLGIVRVGGFATGIRVSLLPVLDELATTVPGVKVIISGFEPVEAFGLLVNDDLDLALITTQPAPRRARPRSGISAVVDYTMGIGYPCRGT